MATEGDTSTSGARDSTGFPAPRHGSLPGSRLWRQPFAITLTILVGLMLLAPLALLAINRRSAAESAKLLNSATKWYADPNSNAAGQAAAWRASRPADAAQMDKIAAQPQADWFGEWSGDIRKAVDGRVTTINAAGALPLLVAYNIPFRDCGAYSKGGANDPARYKAWISDFAAGIGNRPAVVILEPDALALTDCLTDAQRAERFDLLKAAIQMLSARPQVAVYVDAGHSAWRSADEMARRLQTIGIDRAAGFALNVSNYQTTPNLIDYGKRVSALIGAKGGTHFVLDTSRNGKGPWSGPDNWCNPPDRALGERPSTRTADPLVAAYLWIKRPGESDGACRGGPAAGTWWPEYALGLAQRAEY